MVMRDVNIVKTAIKESMNCNVTLIGKDTDLLVLLLNLLQKSDGERKVRDILCYREVIGSEIYKALLFIHAFTGCDTTSSFVGIGKG